MKKNDNLLIAVDPGANGGWALWIGDEYNSCGIMNGDSTHAIYRLIGGLSAKYEGLHTLAIEDQYIGNNWNTGKVLITRRVRWQTIAELFAWDVTLINPSRWQARILRGVPGSDTKEKSCTVAAQVAGKPAPTSDVADAICIGSFYKKQGLLDAQQALFPQQATLPKARKQRANKAPSKGKTKR